MNAQQQPGAEPQAYGVLAAIDWADQKHYFELQTADGKVRQSGTLDNTPEAVEEWVLGLEKSYGGQAVAVAIEQKRGAVVTMLRKYATIHIYPVHAKSLSTYRETWYPSRSKSDASDTSLLLEMLTKHRDRLESLKPEAEPVRMLMNPPACWMRSNAFRSTTRSLMSGNAFARNGSTTITSPSLKLRM